MNQYEIEKLIQDTKELRDIRDEYQKTERLLKENKQEELQQHLQIVLQYPQILPLLLLLQIFCT